MDVNEAPTYPKTEALPSSQLDSLETTLHGSTSYDPLGPENDPTDPGVDFRHSGWQPRRNRVHAALDGMTNEENRLARFEDCGSHAWVLESDDDPGVYRVSCNKCKDRFCEPCAGERSRHIANCVAQYSKDREIRFITLTLRFSDNTIKQDVDRLYKAFIRLRRRILWTKTQTGGIYFIEIKRRGDDNGWHVHLHILSEGLWICNRSLSKAWREITGDSFIVDIKECESREHAARYAAKYSGKGVHGRCYHDPAILREAMEAIKGRRLVGKWGTWSDLELKQENPDEEWHAIDTLDRLIRRSEHGDLKAAQILQSLTGERPCKTNPTEHRGRGP